MRHSTSISRRWLQDVVGAALVAVGLFGLSTLWPGTASAQSADRPDGHENMHEMMDAMHGEGTAERMHKTEGAEEMMDECTSMMAMMKNMGMSEDRMMDGRGMSGLGDMMAPR